MAEWYVLWSVIGAAALATLLAAGLALASGTPALRAHLLQQARAAMPTPLPPGRGAWPPVRTADVAQFWRTFQAEVLAELARAPHLPPAPVGPPDPLSAVPPLYLYHGTRRTSLASIFVRGIEGRTAGWAFVARDEGTARQYGRSRGGEEYVVFRILAQQAYQNGVRFETRGSYYVAQHIHPQYIDFHWAIADLAQRQNGGPGPGT